MGNESASSALLEVKNLTKHFPVSGGKVVHAVDDVSFAITRGKTLGLVGESGCGKSTCARTVIRIYEPTSGRIILDGNDITELSQKQLLPHRRKMQMIFQDPYASLNSRMTVQDIIAEPLRAHHICGSKAEEREMVAEMLLQVGLSQEHASRYAHEFSGGQRQRVGIARALIQEQRGLTYLFIAHDLSMVRYVSDDVGVMYLGQLVEKCEAGEIYSHPQHPYTIGLLDSVPIPDPVAAREKENVGLEGDLPSPIAPPAGCRFHTRCPYAEFRCMQEVPKLLESAPGHFVACHKING